MPRFCENENCDGDMVICQSCGRDLCSLENEFHRIGGRNVCDACKDKLVQNFRSIPLKGNPGYDLLM